MNREIIIPFIISLMAGLSTLIGCFFLVIKPKNVCKFIGISLAFSATIMILISIFELIPEGFYYIVKSNGLLLCIFMLILMILIGYLLNTCINKKIAEKGFNSSNLYRVGILSMIALMIHNLPEGILTFLSSSVDIKLGLKLSIAIMLHTIPEGIAIAVPIYYSTGSRGKAVINTLISGLSEPIGALLAYLFLYKYMSNFLISIILLFVAGIMISISINDIFDEARKYSNKYILIGFILGVIMIVVTQFVL